jgi:hypothetical protein
MANPLKFPVSPAILAEFNTAHNRGLFNDAYFVLELNPQGGYQASGGTNRELRGDAVGNTLTAVRRSNYQIQLETVDGREAIKSIFEAIQFEAGDLPFDVHDYQHPDRADLGAGYTVRKMILKESPTPLGGTFDSVNWGKLGLGWRIVLESI